MRLTDLADVLRTAGVKVAEVDGWKARGSDAFTPRGVVMHHTAGSKKGNAPSLGVCVNGREGLPGPLCQILIGRDATAHVIASGRANHAGAGGWQGLSGNSSVVGIEIENDGVGEPFSDEVMTASIRAAAAVLRRLGRDEQWLCGHKEWAPGRKVDPRGWDMNAFRARVQARLSGPIVEPGVDVKVAVLWDPGSEVDEGFARLLGAALRLKPLALGHSERVGAAIAVGKAAKTVNRALYPDGVERLSGSNREVTAVKVWERAQSLDRTVRVSD